MKIGILTLTLHTNYGGILQAYALQTVLEKMGHEVEVLNRPFTPLKTKWKEIPKRIVKKLLGRDLVIFSEKQYNREAPIINKVVWNFRKKYIHERIINSLHEIKEGDYDCIVVGSDQVWRPRYFKSQWNIGIADAFLAFTKGWNIKRIAYAVSYGVDTWEYTKEENVLCKDVIKQFDFLSVREESGIMLTREHFDVKAIQLVDPTLLLGKDDYIKLFNKKDTPQSGGSLLVYFLDANHDKNKLVNQISKEKGLIPFSINRTAVKRTAPINKRILPSVESWLRGFYDAEFVVTDSFHACVFSIIFGKPFVVVGNKERGMTRFQSLLKMFSLEQNLISSIEEYTPGCSYQIHEDARKQLEEYKDKSLAFLKESLA